MLIEESSRRVLIVDDDELAREFVMTLMQNEGWETHEAHNGQEGVDMALSVLPRLIILDVDMPVMSGFEALQELRGDPRTEDIPGIMLTGINESVADVRHDELSVERDLGVRGPEAFVDKPVDPSYLMSAIMGVVG